MTSPHVAVAPPGAGQRGWRLGSTLRPWSAMLTPPVHRLITICFSHYVERARWALDRFGVEYREEGYMPVLHFAPVFAVHLGFGGRSDRASSRMSTPVLVRPNGERIADSRRIMDYVDREFAPEGARLYPPSPSDPLAEFERRWHDRLAPHTRRLCYVALFDAPETLHEIARHNVGPRQLKIFERTRDLTKRALERYLSLDEGAADRSRAVIDEELDAVAELLADGRPYLAGDRFSGADLSFASFTAPLCLPPEYGAWLPSREDFTEEFVAGIDAYREHPAVRHAARIYAEHRHERI